jgi:hypothetical protein
MLNLHLNSTKLCLEKNFQIITKDFLRNYKKRIENGEAKCE